MKLSSDEESFLATLAAGIRRDEHYRDTSDGYYRDMSRGIGARVPRPPRPMTEQVLVRRTAVAVGVVHGGMANAIVRHLAPGLAVWECVLVSVLAALVVGCLYAVCADGAKGM